MNIGIIGLGYVGITFAAAAMLKGHDVWGIEVNKNIKDSLRRHKAHFFEVGLDYVLHKYKDKLHIIENFNEAKVKFDAFIITVGTPLKPNKKPNFEYIKSSLRTLKDIYDGSQLVILRSTVSVGTTRKTVVPYLAKMCGKNEAEILAAMCPERTIEGKALEELTWLPQIISGNNESSLKKAKKLFSTITPKVIEASSLEEAELIKLYCNIYRDMSFAIGNAFAFAAQTFGVDGGSAIIKANLGYARANIPSAGFVAGPCIEKDAYILTNNMTEKVAKRFIMQARKYNESLSEKVLKWVKDKIGEPNKNKVIALSGMAFKGRPETSDLRGSASVDIAKNLKAEGYVLRLHDFKANREEMENLQLGKVYDDIPSLVKNVDLLMILNNHKKYADIDTVMLDNTAKNVKILDIWSAATKLLKNKSLDIVTINNMFIKEKP